LLVLALAALSAQAIAGAVARADAARNRWGAAREIVVARTRLEVDDVVSAGDVESASWPVALVPRGAIDASQDLAGRTVVEAIEPGSAVVAAQLAPDGLHGIAALIPIGWRALAVPIAQASVPVSVGDRIDLVAAVSGSDASASPPFVLAANAVVVATNGQSITVAVPAADAPRVALGIVTGSVVPALRPG
jgi:Flp pilus assembly protein CpaB